MNPSAAFYLLLLSIGAVTALEYFTYFDREPGDRPIFIRTLQSIETEEIAAHNVYYEWFGVNQTLTQVYVEMSSGWEMARIEKPDSPEYPLFLRTFKLEVAAPNTTQLTVSFIVFGFENQSPTHPGANVTLLEEPANMVTMVQYNDV